MWIRRIDDLAHDRWISFLFLAYMHVFKPVIQSVIDFYRPSVIVLQVRFIGIEILLFCFGSFRIHLYWHQSEGDIATRWVHREANLVFTLSGNEDWRKNSLSRSLFLGVNKPLTRSNFWIDNVHNRVTNVMLIFRSVEPTRWEVIAWAASTSV